MQSVTVEDVKWYNKCLEDFPEAKSVIEHRAQDESCELSRMTIYEQLNDFY